MRQPRPLSPRPEQVPAVIQVLRVFAEGLWVALKPIWQIARRIANILDEARERELGPEADFELGVRASVALLLESNPKDTDT